MSNPAHAVPLLKLSGDSPEMLEQLKQRAQHHWNEISPYTVRGSYHQIPQLLCRMRGYPNKY